MPGYIPYRKINEEGDLQKIELIAYYDEDGNNIKETYASKGEVSSSNDDIEKAIERANAAANSANTAAGNANTAANTANTAASNIETLEEEITTAESGRVSAENARKTAETARQTAETNRASAFTSAQNARQQAYEDAEAERERIELLQAQAKELYARLSTEIEELNKSIVDKVEGFYNRMWHRFGDHHPDFMAAVTDLTANVCIARDKEMPIPEGIFCRSIGSVMNGSGGGRFPMNLSYVLVKHFNGENDGLVSADSFEWGEEYTLLRTEERIGISHCDMIDLDRKDINGFDVRDFYVDLVADLKARGL